MALRLVPALILSLASCLPTTAYAEGYQLVSLIARLCIIVTSQPWPSPSPITVIAR